MDALYLKPPLTGEELTKRLSEKIVHTPIVEGLLYKDASLMVVAQPSVGKSVISTQVCMQICAAVPVFGALNVPEPKKIWYMQMERPETETLERIQMMQAGIPLVAENFVLDIELQKLNFLNDEHFAYIIARGRQIKPDIIWIDPLYGVAPGLSNDDVASKVTKKFTILKAELNVTLACNHHTTKNTDEIIDGAKVAKFDPFYGSQWLKAHMTACYYAEHTEHGTRLSNRKDSHSNLLKTLDLYFDHETYISTLKPEEFQFKDRYRMYINAKYKSPDRMFHFEACRAQLGCAVRSLRGFIAQSNLRGVLRCVKSPGNKAIYEVLGPESD